MAYQSTTGGGIRDTGGRRATGGRLGGLGILVLLVALLVGWLFVRRHSDADRVGPPATEMEQR